MKKKAQILSFANIAEGVHPTGRTTVEAEAAIPARRLLLKHGTGNRQALVAGASDQPAFVAGDSANVGDVIEGAILGAATGTLLVVTAEAIARDDDLYTAAGGKVQKLPSAPGTYYKVGRALVPAEADSDVEFVHQLPEPVVV